MPPLDQIRESIEARIAELKNEMVALETARAALRGGTAIGATTTASRKRAAEPERRRTPNAASNTPGAAATAKTTNDPGAHAPAALDDKVSAKSADPPKRRPQTKRRPANHQKPVEVLRAGKLEAMLTEVEDGLSAITISKRSNAGYDQVLALLRERESAGQVRRTGTRRTSLWRLITDEERIVERAAELARLSTAKS